SSPKAATCRSTPKPTSTRSPRSSTDAPAKPSHGKLQQNGSTTSLQRPLETAPALTGEVGAGCWGVGRTCTQLAGPDRLSGCRFVGGGATFACVVEGVVATL